MSGKAFSGLSCGILVLTIRTLDSKLEGYFFLRYFGIVMRKFGIDFKNSTRLFLVA